MISADLGELKRRAGRWRRALGTGTVIAGESTVGGGSLPGETLPTWVLALDVPHPDAFAARLRRGDPPLIARIAADRVLLDPRTVLLGQDKALLANLKQVLSEL